MKIIYLLDLVDIWDATSLSSESPHLFVYMVRRVFFRVNRIRIDGVLRPACYMLSSLEYFDLQDAYFELDNVSANVYMFKNTLRQLELVFVVSVNVKISNRQKSFRGKFLCELWNRVLINRSSPSIQCYRVNINGMKKKICLCFTSLVVHCLYK